MSSPSFDGDDIVRLATGILNECSSMERECQVRAIGLPTLATGTLTTFWSQASPQISSARAKALGQLRQLTTLLEGPHEFLHEYVAPTWDHGALYAFLQSQALDHIASSKGGIPLDNLSKQCGIPEDKLSRILGLLRCQNIVHEPEAGVFTLTAISEEMSNDADFRAWVEFQLFETRVASAHLADALSLTPNEYANGTSGFKQGWGVEMYEWHAQHAEKGDRFRRAMRGVSKTLDPADSLLRRWFQSNAPSVSFKLVEIGGRYGFGSIALAKENPKLSVEVRCDSEDFLSRGKAQVAAESKVDITFTLTASPFDPPPTSDLAIVTVYVIRNLFWNWTDGNVVKLLRTLLPTLKSSRSARILVTDGVSPLPNEYPPHVEVAYRRRDITTMTMHNTKQRTQAEWLKTFADVDPSVKVKTSVEPSSHVCKGLWELRLDF